MKTAAHLILASLALLIIISGNAFAFTVKGMTGGMSLSELRNKYPTSEWEERSKGVWYTDSVSDTVGGSKINYISVFSYTPNAASEIMLGIACGVTPPNFLNLLTKIFGQPYEVSAGYEDSGYLFASWLKGNRIMRLYSTRNTKSDSCHTLTLYDEVATKKHIEFMVNAKRQREGSKDDF